VRQQVSGALAEADADAFVAKLQSRWRALTLGDSALGDPPGLVSRRQVAWFVWEARHSLNKTLSRAKEQGDDPPLSAELRAQVDALMAKSPDPDSLGFWHFANVLLAAQGVGLVLRPL
jgi:hypothetical protein